MKKWSDINSFDRSETFFMIDNPLVVFLLAISAIVCARLVTLLWLNDLKTTLIIFNLLLSCLNDFMKF